MANYWVATTGDNDGAGTEGDPWATLQYAANAVVAGDTVYVKPGTYSSAPGSYYHFICSKTGAADNRIAFRSQFPKAAIINHSAASGGNNRAIEIGGYTTVADFKVVGGENAIFTSADSVGTIISGNECTQQTLRAIETGSGTRYLTLAHNYIHDRNTAGSTTTDGHAIYLGGRHASIEALNTVVYGNVIHNWVFDGIWVNPDADTFHRKASKMHIYGNIIYDCRGGGIAMNNMYDSVIENNVIYVKGSLTFGVAGRGLINLQSYSGADLAHHDVTIRNNTLIANENWGTTCGIEIYTLCHDNNVFNNIVMIPNSDPNKRIYDWSGTGTNRIEGNYNEQYTLSKTNALIQNWSSPTVSGAFQLKADAPCRTTNPAKPYCIPFDSSYGVKYAPTTDYDGNPRPIPNPGGTWDVGAYQYQYNNLSAWPYYVLRANDDSTPTSEYWTAVSG